MPDARRPHRVSVQDLAQRRTAAHTRTPDTQALVTIATVSQACNLPQPVVAQLVPRTWTDNGWMYTAAQLQFAVQIAPDVRAGRYTGPLMY